MPEWHWQIIRYACLYSMRNPALADSGQTSVQTLSRSREIIVLSDTRTPLADFFSILLQFGNAQRFADHQGSG
jgi:hypothetical protein